MKLNPFLVGKPVPPEKFFGRAETIRTLFGRINNRETNYLVGQPHVGKSSVLKYLADRKTRQERLNDIENRRAWVVFDCHDLPGGYQPSDFWRRVFKKLTASFQDGEITTRCQAVEAAGYENQEIKDLFEYLGDRQLNVVLLLDEFETLVRHPNLGRPDFLGLLRSAASWTNGFSMVTASRIRQADMNRIVRSDGSPYFSLGPDIVLPPLDAHEVDQLITTMLAGSGIEFDEEDRGFISAVAGGHPYLVQATASALFDASVSSAESRHAHASRSLLQRTGSFFEDLWASLSTDAQVAVSLLALADVHGRVNGRDFSTAELSKLEFYTPELNHLAELGLAKAEPSERATATDWGIVVDWNGAQWQLAAASFGWWVCREPIARGRKGRTFEEWLSGVEYNGLMTQEQWKSVGGVVSAMTQAVKPKLLESAWELAQLAAKKAAGL